MKFLAALIETNFSDGSTVKDGITVDVDLISSNGNMNASPSTREIVCLQCGDVGFSNAFVYCVKCLEFAVHRYCLQVIPKTLDEFVRWICDGCESDKQNQHVLSKKASLCKTRDHTMPEHILGCSVSGTKKKDTVQPMVEEPVYEGGPHQSYDVGPRGMNDEVVGLSAANERSRRGQSSSQLNEEEKVKDNMIFNELSAHSFPRDYMKEKKSASASSVMRKDQFPLGNNSSDRPYKDRTNIGFAALASDSMAAKDVKEIKASLKRDQGRLYQQHDGSDPESTAALPPLSSCRDSSGSSKKIPSSANLKDQEQKSLLAQHVKKHKGVDFGTQCSNMTTDRRGVNQIKESKVSKEGEPASNRASYSCKGISKDSTVLPVVDRNICAEPILAPIWRGSFNIWNKEDDLLEEVMGHLSILACQKVYDEASLLATVIHMEMLSRSHVWPKSFKKSEPSADSIALYFFPSERTERVYDDLVNELVEEELALKATVQNAELLVFPSTKLPLPYWRFQGKYYLWGVFVEKRSPATSRQESGDNPVMRKDHGDDTGSCGTRKNVRGESPLSPLSNCTSYCSRTC